LAGHRFLITGGCGFVGANLVRRIKDRYSKSVDLIVVDNETAGTPADLPPGVVTYRRADVRDYAALAEVASRCDTIIHLAAHSGVIDSIEDPNLNFEVNARGTLNVLLAARDAGVRRVVLASTGGAILGETDPPVHEEMLPRPLSPYGASKLAAEAYATAFGHCYGLQVTALRFANVYGPYSRHKGSAVAGFFRRILARRPITVYGDGSQVRDFVFVEDVCDGILQALDSNVSGVFQLGTGQPTSICTLLQEMRRVVGSDWPVEVVHEPRRPGEIVATYCDVSKARRSFGYRPEVTLATGLPRTWRWFLDDAAKSIQ
jgi:UDP-glucose 4-epimerase